MSNPEQHRDVTAQIGVIGMGVMGTNLARNLARHGYRTAIWNIDFQRTQAVARDYASEGTFIPTETIQDFVDTLETPRKILLMITAGPAVDAVKDNLSPLLAPGDIIMDGGNSFFQDTRRREVECAKQGLHFMGVGISGGEVGALEGPSIMPGGSPESYAAVGPFLEAISAHVDHEPCCAWMGTDGAGHFVKMVHNGIEYADIQVIAEAYDLLSGFGFSTSQMADIFDEWNTGELESYLIETASDVLSQTDAATGKPLLDVIKDRSQMKGTGTWTVQQALELGVPAAEIGEAVFARSLSSHDELRTASRAVLTGPPRTLPEGVDKDCLVEDIRRALFASKIVAYAQGLDQIRTAGKTYHWMIDMAEVAKIWRAGCVIRSTLLQRIRDEYATGDVVSLMTCPSVAQQLNEYGEAWRRVVTLAVQAGIPVPGMSSALAYFDSARAERLPANLVQGLRDFFGAHTYERLDREGQFHTQWSSDRTEVAVPGPQHKAEATENDPGKRKNG